MKENEVPVRHFTDNNLVPVPGKATASDAKKYMKWLAHLGFENQAGKAGALAYIC